MSDLLIRGMELPENCWSCKMFCNCYACEGYDCHCAALGEDIGTEAEVPRNKRRDDCCLIPVPPHGRLIDADALCNRLEKAGKIKPYLESGLNVAISFALTAPTIIPAEIISENEIKIIDTKGKSNYDPKRRFVIPAEEEST